MDTSKLISADKVTELVLELSADALIQKRAVAKDSPAFQSLTGAISAYGRVLAELTILQESDELFVMAGQPDDALEHAVTAEGVNYVA